MTTIVTCYYLLDKSKHSPSNYQLWINNLFLNLKNVNLIIFTSVKHRSQIEEIFNNNI